MRLSGSRDVPLTAAKALQEEFVQLHGPLPASYHQWLEMLPDLPKLWLVQKDHFIDATQLIADLTERSTPLTSYLWEQLSADTLKALGACGHSRLACDSMFELLAGDLNAIITRETCIHSSERFAHVSLTPETLALVRQRLQGRKLEILNRLLLEEAFPNSLARVWDTLGGVFAILRSRPSAALCISGGGIRSATFGLGVLQGLARHDLLGQFDYISTVSGGGYIGSWLSSWIHHKGSAQQVFDEIKNIIAKSPAEPEPKPLRHLRAFSNYLTPRLGAFSADTWTLIGTYLRNLLLNWLTFVPLMLAALALPRLCVALLHQPAHPWAAGLLFAAGCVFATCGIAYGAMQRPSMHAVLATESRFWSRRSSQQDFLFYCFVPLCLAAFCFTTFWAWLPEFTFELPRWWALALSGAVLHLAGWMMSRLVLKQFKAAELIAVLLTGALGGFGLWFVGRETFQNLIEPPALELYISFAPSVFILIFLITASLFIGLGSRRTGDSDREWWARMGAWLLIGAVVWSGFFSLVIFGPMALQKLNQLSPMLTVLGGVPGLITLVLGYSGRTGATREKNAPRSLTDRLLSAALALAAPLFVVFIGALLSLATTELLRLRPSLANVDHLHLIDGTPAWLAALVIVSSGGFGLLMSWLININLFTLHSVYRNRLIRAYLGASNPKRDPNPFTGFDPKDNLRLYQLAGQRPLHVINMALNLVSGENLAWQQRKAETFTASSLHAGNYRLGYRRIRDYAQNEAGHGLSLGTAVTISGAAASPNMGYHSSPVVAALMTLFNVRLGAWLGNPGPAGNGTFTHPGPRSAALHVIKEAFGVTDSDSGYVYLSDGGHFENLGLYEMVLRRCQFIVVSDGGCDFDCQLDDLGNAIRKIRVDLGVPIEMRRFEIYSRTDERMGRHCAVGEILYDRVDGPNAPRGLLIYIKPAITGDEPRDVFNYKETSEQFPHEPTSDQWFSESQFESYRMLGLHTVTEMCQDWSRAREQRPDVNPLALFARQTYKSLEMPFPPEMAARVETLPRPLVLDASARRETRQATEHETKLMNETQSF
jgi:hypothetical protein